MSNEKTKQSSIYLDDDLKTALKMAVIHNPEWRNVSDFIREACWEKLSRLSKHEKDDRQAKIEDYFKDREGK